MTPARSRVGGQPEERAQLERWVRAATTPQRVVRRSRIVLLALDGMSAADIAARLDVSQPTVKLWIKRFASGGASMLLHDAPGRGRHPSIGYDTIISRLRAANMLDGEGRPTSLRDAAQLLSVSPSTIWRALHKGPSGS